MKEGQPNKEVLYTNPEPFNHGTTSIQYVEVPKSVHEELAAVLRNGWQIDQATSIGQDYSKPEVSSNNFRVVNESGTYLLKLSHINRPEEQEVVNSSIDYCRENGISVAVINRTIEGKLFFVSGGRTFCLFDFIDGEHFDGSRHELLEVAEKLPQFNNVLRNSPLRDHIRHSKTFAHHNYETLDEMIQIVRSGNKISKFDREVEIVLDEIEQESKEVRLAEIPNLPMQVVHTDLHPHNLLFDRQTRKLLAFIDFDSLEYSQRIRGVAFTMHRLARTFGERTERKNDTGTDMRDRAKLFLTRYTEAGELTSEELEAVSLIIKDEALRRITLVLAGHYLKGDSRNDFELPKQLTTLREVKLFE